MKCKIYLQNQTDFNLLLGKFPALYKLKQTHTFVGEVCGDGLSDILHYLAEEKSYYQVKGIPFLDEGTLNLGDVVHTDCDEYYIMSPAGFVRFQ